LALSSAGIRIKCNRKLIPGGGGVSFRQVSEKRFAGCKTVHTSVRAHERPLELEQFDNISY